jgi:hypothetical protein
MSLGSKMEGLAQQMAGQPAQKQNAQGMPTVEQIIEMLLQGADPDELVQMGIPPELLMQAIEVLEQQAAAQQVPAEQQGLATQAVMGM